MCFPETSSSCTSDIVRASVHSASNLRYRPSIGLKHSTHSEFQDRLDDYVSMCFAESRGRRLILRAGSPSSFHAGRVKSSYEERKQLFL
jgi:hypothetical protein